MSGLTDEEKRKPDELRQFFENQLKVNINVRINRLPFMRYRQRPEEHLDQFVIRARTLGLKCDFSDMELSERLLELIISSTPHDSAQLIKTNVTHVEHGDTGQSCVRPRTRSENMTRHSDSTANLHTTEAVDTDVVASSLKK